MYRALLLAFLLSGCFRDADPIALDRSPAQVHAILQAGSDSATILLSRPPGPTETFATISGATVRLVHAGQVIDLVERSDGRACIVEGRTLVGTGSGCYSAALPQPVQPGSAWGLEVILPGGTRVTGQTIVPHPVRLIDGSPLVYELPCPPIQSTPSCRSEYDQNRELKPLALLELRWDPPAADVDRVDATFRIDRIVSRGVTYPGDRCDVEPLTLYQPARSVREVVRWPVHAVYCLGPLDVLGWDTIYVQATVAAYDRAYSSYFDAILDRDAARYDAVSAGLDGALGVFGSVAATTRELALVRVTAPPRQ